MKNKFLTFLGLIIIVGAVLIIYMQSNVSANPYLETKNNNNCLKCHEMKSKGESLKLTAHKGFTCKTCHINVESTLNYLKHVTDRYNKDIKLYNVPGNDVCLQCHTNTRNITPPQNLIIPHEYHLQRGIDCIDCHRYAAHGDINKQNNNRIPMNTCLKCHNGYKASNKCQACHVVVPKQKQT